MIVIKTKVEKKGISTDKIIIYQITHKYCYKLPYQEGYIPMYVGATGNKNVPAGYMRDDVGDNISEKNNSYCELSGLYWIWKNCEADIVGLVHYRRYFGQYDCFSNYHTWHIKKPWKKNWFSILSVDEICEYCIFRSK